MTIRTAARPIAPAAIALRVAIVALTLSTAYIHSTLGGFLFLANASGYVVLAVAMVLPLTFAAELRWLTRLALMGYAAVTIVGWLIMGPRFTLAYIAKAIEVTLIVLLAVEQYRTIGGPTAVVRRLAALAGQVSRRFSGVGTSA